MKLLYQKLKEEKTMPKLQEYCLNITDGEHGSVIDDNSGNYYLLSNKNMVNGEIVITSEDRKISEESFRKINKRTKLSTGDVLISTVGTIGKVAFVTESTFAIICSVRERAVLSGAVTEIVKKPKSSSGRNPRGRIFSIATITTAITATIAIVVRQRLTTLPMTAP